MIGGYRPQDITWYNIVVPRAKLEGRRRVIFPLKSSSSGQVALTILDAVRMDERTNEII